MAINWKKRARPGSAQFKLDAYPFFLMNQAAARYNEALAAALSDAGIDQPAWRVLMILAECEPASAGDIAEAAVMKRSTLTRVLQRMAADGLIEMRARRSDARVTEIRMTRRGRAALQKVRQVAATLFDRAMDGVDSEEIRLLNTTLAKIAANLSRRL
ncbi:MAG: MarR family transcriptional regulator [Parvularculaceae bacterium]